MGEYSVYKHTCPNGKCYIGITRQKPTTRWGKGKGYNANIHFKRAIDAYGWENIIHEVLYEGLTQKEACDKERELISKYHSNNPQYGYNHTSGGQLGVVLNDEVRKTISQRLKEFYSTHPEKCKEIAERVKGFTHTEEARRKISNAKRGRSIKRTPEQNKRVSEANKKAYAVGTKAREIASARCRENGYKARVGVVQYTLEGEKVAEYESMCAARRATGIGSGNISKCCAGKACSASGYRWAYAQSGRETA